MTRNLHYQSLIAYKIKQRARGEIADISLIKEEIRRLSLRHGGMPSSMVKYIIEDLIALKLITKICNGKYRLLNNPLEQKIKTILIFY